jgi:hypothetical protein
MLTCNQLETTPCSHVTGKGMDKHICTSPWEVRSMQVHMHPCLYGLSPAPHAVLPSPQQSNAPPGASRTGRQQRALTFASSPRPSSRPPAARGLSSSPTVELRPAAPTSPSRRWGRPGRRRTARRSAESHRRAWRCCSHECTTWLARCNQHTRTARTDPHRLATSPCNIQGV